MYITIKARLLLQAKFLHFQSPHQHRRNFVAYVTEVIVTTAPECCGDCLHHFSKCNLQFFKQF